MKFYMSQSAILQGIQTVQRAVPLKSPLTYLQAILLKAQGNRLFFAATDMELGILYEQDAQIEEEGSILLPARLFSEIIRRLPEDIIECESTGRSIVLRYGDADFTLNGFDPEEFPEISGVSGSIRIKLPGQILKKLIHQVSFACKIDDEKGGVFAGILVKIADGLLTLVATDTHRLAINTESYDYIADDNEGDEESSSQSLSYSWIIPNKSMLEIGRLLRNDDIVVIEGNRESSRLNFKFGDHTSSIYVMTRIIEGRFPNYQQVIPSTCSGRILLDRELLLEAAERANLLSRDSYLKTSTVRLSIEDQAIVINQVSEMGKIFEKVPVEFTGDGVSITFNVRYIIEALKNMDSQKVMMEISGAFGPCVFRPYDSENESYISLILPLRH